MTLVETKAPASWRGRILRVGLSAIVLSLFAAPALAQEQPGQTRKSDEPTKPPAYDSVYQGFKRAAEPQTPDLDQVRAQLKMLEAELQRKKAESEQIAAQIAAARARMAQAEKAKADAIPTDMPLRVFLDNSYGANSAEPQEIVLRLVNGVWKVVEPKEKPKNFILKGISDGKGGFKIIEDGVEVAPAKPVPAPMGGGAGSRTGTPPPMAPPSPGSPGGIGLPGARGAGGPMTAPPHAPGSPDARIDDLEKKLNKVMEMIEQMRKEADGSRKRAENTPSEADRARAARDAVEAAERNAIREKAQAVEREIQRIETARRALEEAAKKKAPQPENQRQP